MWKWLGGCLLVCIVLVILLFWWSFKSIQDSVAPDGSISVMIGAPPERVFASMATADSLATWMSEGGSLETTRRGRLQPGDFLRIRIRGTGRGALSWYVTEVVPNRLVALQLRADSTGEIVATKRDSLSVEGDSTRVSSRLVSRMLEQPVRSATDTMRVSDGVGDVAATMIMSMFRLQSRTGLERLKSRIEQPSPSR